MVKHSIFLVLFFIFSYSFASTSEVADTEIIDAGEELAEFNEGSDEELYEEPDEELDSEKPMTFKDIIQSKPFDYAIKIVAACAGVHFIYRMHSDYKNNSIVSNQISGTDIQRSSTFKIVSQPLIHGRDKLIVAVDSSGPSLFKLIKQKNKTKF